MIFDRFSNLFNFYGKTFRSNIEWKWTAHFESKKKTRFEQRTSSTRAAAASSSSSSLLFFYYSNCSAACLEFWFHSITNHSINEYFLLFARCTNHRTENVSHAKCVNENSPIKIFFDYNRLIGQFGRFVSSLLFLFRFRLFGWLNAFCRAFSQRMMHSSIVVHTEWSHTVMNVHVRRLSIYLAVSVADCVCLSVW